MQCGSASRIIRVPGADLRTSVRGESTLSPELSYSAGLLAVELKPQRRCPKAQMWSPPLAQLSRRELRTSRIQGCAQRESQSPTEGNPPERAGLTVRRTGVVPSGDKGAWGWGKGGEDSLYPNPSNLSPTLLQDKRVLIRS